MWALLRVISYSIEINLSKSILTKVKPMQYLANKYLIGFFLFLLYFITTDIFINIEGLLVLGLMLMFLTLHQIFSFTSLTHLNASTHTVLDQSRLIFLLLIGLMFGNAITGFKIISVILCICGVFLILNDELKRSPNKRNTFIGFPLALLSAFCCICSSYLLQYAFEQNYFSLSVYCLIIIGYSIIFYALYEAIRKKRGFVYKPLSKKQFNFIQLTGILSILVMLSQAFSIKYFGNFLTEITFSLAPASIFLIAVITKAEKFKLIQMLGITLSIAGVIIGVIL